jgi:hypothetical protein
LAVPSSPVSYCKYLLLPLCHGRGREFESRRPRHILKDLQLGRCFFWVQLGCNRIRDCCYPQLHWQNRFDQLLLGSASRARCRLQILVGHTEIAVTQVIADRQLVLPHLRKQRSDRVPKRVPAHRIRDTFLRFQGSRSQESEEPLRAFWQARFYNFNVYTQRKTTERLNSMHANPVIRGLVEHPKDWPWSSWSFYRKGEPGLIRIEKSLTEKVKPKS